MARTGLIAATVALLGLAAPAGARGHGGGHGLFGAPHGHPINAWMGSHHLRLR